MPTMRQPTPASKIYRWHRLALDGKRPPIHDGVPECGHFKTRIVKGGPFVPARIWLDRSINPDTAELTDDERYFCEINGERRDAYQHWVWLSKSPISKAEYDELVQMHQQMPSLAATHVPFDLSKEIIRP